ncbi:MAG: outer membrane beta-barrel protein [Steroidobacteraceae bacterium]
MSSSAKQSMRGPWPAAACGILLALALPQAFAAPAASAAAPAVAGWPQTLAAWGITVSGDVAVSWYGSNGYPFNIHQFDTQHDTFQLDEAGLQVGYQPQQGFGAFADLIAGEDARILHLAEDGHDNSFDARQAYIQYTSGRLTLIGGKFVTLAGAEVIDPAQDASVSRSLLFTEAEPLDHTGIRATYVLTSALTLIGGINDGWNVTAVSYGSKTGEAGVAWTPTERFSLASQGYFGKAEYLPGTSVRVDADRTLVDLVATLHATPALTFAVNADWIRQDQAGGPRTRAAEWDGIAAYLDYRWSARWRVSLRGEYLDDKDGLVTATAGGQHLWEGTVTLGFYPAKRFELRLEGRYDAAQAPFFYRSDPTRASSASPALLADSLSEIALQGVYAF